ncbi:hypothetical protein LTR66_014162, partial [Elasticomyces elasticus]
GSSFDSNGSTNSNVGVKMLGQLLSSFTTSRRDHARYKPSLESRHEDQYTRGLLYPSLTDLAQPEGRAELPSLPRTPEQDDEAHGGWLVHESGIRVLIAQDETGMLPKSVLFDSQPVNTDNSPRQQRTSRIPRIPSCSNGSALHGKHSGVDVTTIRSSTTKNTLEPDQRRSTASVASQAGHARTASASGRVSKLDSPTKPAREQSRLKDYSSLKSSPEDSRQNQKARDDDEEIKSCLGCMFGSTAMSYRGPTTKLHILPSSTRMDDEAILRPTSSGTSGFLGLAEERRHSHLSRRSTPQNASLVAQEPEKLHGPSARHRTLLITRTFSVQLAEDVEARDTAIDQEASLSKATTDGLSPIAPILTTHRPQSTQRRSPMYAVALMLRLPSPHTAPSLPHSHPGKSSSLPGPPATAANESSASSPDSDRQGGWTILGSRFDSVSLCSTGCDIDAEDQIDAITQHWETISRTLDSLQKSTQTILLPYLEAVDLASPPPQQAANGPAVSGRRSRAYRPVARRTVKLQHGALAGDAKVNAAVEIAVHRLARGINIPRVVTAQDRWGIWRDEARSICRTVDSHEQEHFFLSLLSAYFATHREWLSGVGPKWYRRKYQEHCDIENLEELIVKSRTVIVSSDKMAARRFVFLLSAFLPASTSLPVVQRPGTPGSLSVFSPSPPMYLAMSRESSRRSMRPKGHSVRTIPEDEKGQQQSGITERDLERQIDRTDVADGGIEGTRTRRSSDAQSTRTASLAFPFRSDSVQKTSTATTVIVAPDEVPVAHFAVPAPTVAPGSHVVPGCRPGSSGSASVNLMRLQRNNSNNVSNASSDSQSATRWGSFASMWSTRPRRESSLTERSDTTPATPSEEGVTGILKSGKDSIGRRSHNKLVRMVEEADRHVSLPHAHAATTRCSDSTATPSATAEDCSASEHATIEARQIPERRRSHSTQVKLSVDEKDGVIDVEIPRAMSGRSTPLLASSSNTTPSLSSSWASKWGQTSMLSMGRSNRKENVANAAGWLSAFHQDFALQAVKPYEALERDIKHTMSQEPTPLTLPPMGNEPGEDGAERWVHLCTTLVADVHTQRLKAIRFSRRIKFVQATGLPATTTGLDGLPSRSVVGHARVESYAASTPAAPAFNTQCLEEVFTEEQITDADSTLAEVVEELLAESAPVSRVTSKPSSRSSSRHRSSHHRSRSDGPSALGGRRLECRNLLFAALHDIVRTVVAERSEDLPVHPRTVESGREGGRSMNAGLALREAVAGWLDEMDGVAS